MTINQKITALREHMQAMGIHALVVPSGDAHLSEYVCDHFRLREYLSGFTGSAGTLVVGLDWAGLWTDGRYHTQAKTQLEGTLITLYPAGTPGVDTLYQVLEKTLQPGQVVAVDGRTISKAQGDVLDKTAKSVQAKLRLDWACPQSLWPERPDLPQGQVHAIDNAGQDASDKLAQLRQAMDGKASAYLISSLDDIAWMLNLRGQDLANTPVFLSHLWVEQSQAILFIQAVKLRPETVAYLQAMGVTVAPYQAIEGHCAQWDGGQVWVCQSQINARLYQLLGKNAADIANYVEQKKAIKNPVEIQNLRNAHKKDAVAMVAFLHYLEQTVGKIPLNEITAAAYLDKQRSEQPGFVNLSFPTICGYGENGAIIHYQATADTCADLKTLGLLLVDSGGQYTDGTTDITRTIPLGPVSHEMSRHYTLVLKGHLALAAAVFPVGTSGAVLDMLARQYLWAEGLDYLHGTGHGVGYRLNVHEGPQTISHLRQNAPAIQAGMVTSNEPGYYLPGSHGIRHENLLLCEKADQEGYLRFTPLTLVPFATTAIDWSLMTEQDCQRLDAYHQMVYDEIYHLLPSNLDLWLQNATKSVACFCNLHKK